MSFTWPVALLLLLAVPAMLGAYLLAMRRRRRRAITYSSIALLRAALPRASRWRRHLPIAALLASLAVLGVASARQGRAARGGDQTRLEAARASEARLEAEAASNDVQLAALPADRVGD